jgi:hypothetical protein
VTKTVRCGVQLGDENRADCPGGAGKRQRVAHCGPRSPGAGRCKRGCDWRIQQITAGSAAVDGGDDGTDAYGRTHKYRESPDSSHALMCNSEAPHQFTRGACH